MTRSSCLSANGPGRLTWPQCGTLYATRKACILSRLGSKPFSYRLPGQARPCILFAVGGAPPSERTLAVGWEPQASTQGIRHGPRHACSSLLGGLRPPKPPRADTLLLDGGSTRMYPGHTARHGLCMSFAGGANGPCSTDTAAVSTLTHGMNPKPIVILIRAYGTNPCMSFAGGGARVTAFFFPTTPRAGCPRCCYPIE